MERGGGEGAEVVPFGHDGAYGAKLKTALKCLNTFVRGCRLFCGVSEKSRFQWLHKEQFQNFLYCFFNNFLISLGDRSRSESVRCFLSNNYSRLPFFEPSENSNQKSFPSPPSDSVI